MAGPPRATRTRLYKGIFAIVAGCALNYFGDRLLGIKIELFHGIQTFNFMWILDMFALPFFVGMLVAVIFGLGGKWLCYFPPPMVRAYSYYKILHTVGGVPHGMSLLPLGWWGFFVILVIEASAFGGVMGEIWVKGTYGRSPRQMIYKESSSKVGED